jgi:hypothetical protein
MEVDNIVDLHKAKCITDDRGYIYNPEVLNKLNVNDIVRISFILDTDREDIWCHDSPYVKIHLIDDINNVMGEIVNIDRQQTNMYPLNVGEKIWFVKNNIIEIPANTQEFKSFLTSDHVQCTGPLYTVLYNEDEEDESSSDEYSTTSDSS